MKVTDSSRLIIAIFVVVGIAVAFWMALLSPKRKEADELSTKVENLKTTLAASESAAVEAEQAKHDFPKNYKQLVVLGKAAPAGDETASLLVQMSRVSDRTETSFDTIKLATTGESVEAAAPPPEESSESSTEEAPAEPAAEVAPTEASVATLPIGSTVGPAGFNVLPYDMLFKGDFFDVADFVEEIDGFVHTEDPGLKVDGRLITINGFALTPADEGGGGSLLKANFSVSTFVVPSDQGLTAGATETGPTEVASVPVEGEAAQ